MQGGEHQRHGDVRVVNLNKRIEVGIKGKVGVEFGIENKVRILVSSFGDWHFRHCHRRSCRPTRFQRREAVCAVLISFGVAFSGIIIGGVRVINAVVIAIDIAESSVEIRLRASLPK